MMMPDHILKRSHGSQERTAEFSVRAMVERADAADAPRGLITRAHAVNGIECCPGAGPGVPSKVSASVLSDRVLDDWPLADDGIADRSGSQTGQRRAPFKNCLRSDFFGSMGPPKRLKNLIHDSKFGLIRCAGA